MQEEVAGGEEAEQTTSWRTSLTQTVSWKTSSQEKQDMVLFRATQKIFGHMMYPNYSTNLSPKGRFFLGKKNVPYN